MLLRSYGSYSSMSLQNITTTSLHSSVSILNLILINCPMKVLFALSNPPSTEFLWTRHNVGRLFITEYILKKYSFVLHEHRNYNSYTLNSNPERVICLTKTYMNLSGQPVGSFIKRNPVLQRNQLIVVHDDLQHKFGNARIKEGGSAQGHNGVQSVIGAVGGKEFKRLQLGIGRPNSRGPEAVSNYVLQNFTKAERGGLEAMFQKGEELLKQDKFF